jgi:hypothetical protein
MFAATGSVYAKQRLPVGLLILERVKVNLQLRLRCACES